MPAVAFRQCSICWKRRPRKFNPGGKKINRFLCAFAVMILLAGQARASEMGELAEQMKPGTWDELKTRDLVETLRSCSRVGMVPASRKCRTM